MDPGLTRRSWVCWAATVQSCWSEGSHEPQVRDGYLLISASVWPGLSCLCDTWLLQDFGSYQALLDFQADLQRQSDLGYSAKDSHSYSPVKLSAKFLSASRSHRDSHAVLISFNVATDTDVGAGNACGCPCRLKRRQSVLLNLANMSLPRLEPGVRRWRHKAIWTPLSPFS